MNEILNLITATVELDEEAGGFKGENIVVDSVISLIDGNVTKAAIIGQIFLLMVGSVYNEIEDEEEAKVFVEILKDFVNIALKEDLNNVSTNLKETDTTDK